ncbi:forkhead associated domain containing protein [Fragilaria crotonensis]|nr:forkhead associated domain containing protein [Fragilaria crotonensis]
MSDRKRNRWGESTAAAPPTVSEDEVVKALLSEAELRQREKERQRPPKQRKGVDRGRDERGHRDGRGDGDRGSHVDRQGLRENDSYYGPSEGQRSQLDMAKEPADEGEIVEKQKPNFGISGALAKDDEKGNVYKGVVLKFSEPPEARAPNTLWRLYVFKGEEALETLHISKQSAYLFGRNEDIADVPLRHASCSSQHAVLQYRSLPNKETGKLQCCPYLMDLESTNGSFINGVRIDSARYYQLKKGDVLKFGASTREYVLLTANTTSVE